MQGQGRRKRFRIQETKQYQAVFKRRGNASLFAERCGGDTLVITSLIFSTDGPIDTIAPWKPEKQRPNNLVSPSELQA